MPLHRSQSVQDDTKIGENVGECPQSHAPSDFFPPHLEDLSSPFGPCYIQLVSFSLGAPHTIQVGQSISGDLNRIYGPDNLDLDALHESDKSLATTQVHDGDVAILRSPQDTELNYFVLIQTWKRIEEEQYRHWLRVRSEHPQPSPVE